MQRDILKEITQFYKIQLENTSEIRLKSCIRVTLYIVLNLDIYFVYS